MEVDGDSLVNKKENAAIKIANENMKFEKPTKMGIISCGLNFKM